MGLRRVGDRPVGRVFVEPVLGAHTPEVEHTEGNPPSGELPSGEPPFSFEGVETLDGM